MGWQLVFDDAYRSGDQGAAVWLARGAPRRWFRTGNGFNVTAAPTRYGRVSYTVTPQTNNTATFMVVPPSASHGVVWKLRWPGKLTAAVQCKGCTVAAVANNDGIAAVTATGTGSFTAS